MKLLKYILYLIQIFAPLDGEIKTFKRLFQNSWYYIKKYLFFFCSPTWSNFTEVGIQPNSYNTPKYSLYLSR